MLGLLFDTLVVRSFMTPSIAALLGRWFWWPRRVRTHADPSPSREPADDAMADATTAPLELAAMSAGECR